MAIQSLRDDSRQVNRLSQIGRPFRVLTSKGRSLYAVFSCSCGGVAALEVRRVKNGGNRSCGCKIAKPHGWNKHPIYKAWKYMRDRCLHSSHPSYKNYGGRGIGFCNEWNTFLPFLDWALNSGWKDGLSLDRIDVNGNYEPSNCRWATEIEQQNNRRSNRFIEAFGERKTVAMWARDERCTVSENGLLHRIAVAGWEPHVAITKPRRSQRNLKPRERSALDAALLAAETERG